MFYYEKTKNFDYTPYCNGTYFMGPSVIRLLDEANLPRKKGMRILDLGCGKGLSSLYLAKEYDVTVFAADLWISPTENYEFFRSLGIEEQIFPIYADANALPFAEGFFDAVISVDAYHYFGAEAGFFSEKILPLLKPDGFAALIFPGWKAPLPTPVPQELLLSWTEEDLTTFQPIQWWKKLFEQEEYTRLLSIAELSCVDEAWADWLATDNPYAIGDRPSMEHGAGKYMNFIFLTACHK